MHWIVWLFAVAFYFYEFFVRVAPSVMVPQLMEEFSITAQSVGTIGAAYFYTYAFMQIPVGLLMDRYGTRLLLTAATFVCGASTILFGLSTSFEMAVFSRLLMGLSSAFGFVGLLYTTVQLFPKRRTAFLIGLGNSLGMMGAVAGEGLLAFFVKHMGWRQSSVAVGVCGLALAGLIAVVMKRGPVLSSQGRKTTFFHLLEGLKAICADGQMWLIACVGFLCYTSINAFGTLWGDTFLVQVYGFSASQAAWAVSLIFIGTIAGGPLLGHWGRELSEKKLLVIACTLAGALCWIPLLYGLLSLWAACLVILAIGFFSSSQLFSYSMAIEQNPSPSKATAVAYVNLIVSVGSSAMQPVIGFLLDLLWQGQMDGAIRVYTARDFRGALSLLPLAFVAACICAFFIGKGGAPVRIIDWARQRRRRFNAKRQ